MNSRSLIDLDMEEFDHLVADFVQQFHAGLQDLLTDHHVHGLVDQPGPEAARRFTEAVSLYLADAVREGPQPRVYRGCAIESRRTHAA